LPDTSACMIRLRLHLNSSRSIDCFS